MVYSILIDFIVDKIPGQKGLVCFILLVSLLLTSCTKEKNNILGEQENIEDQLNLSVWSVYWDIEGASNEIAPMAQFIEEISYFAAYFNQDHGLFIPENINKFYLSSRNRLENRDISHYLSIVNDKINRDGSSSLKDSQLLYELLSDEEKRKEHIGDLVQLCLENGYDGLEVDYEGLKQDEALWLYFIEFISELYGQVSSHGRRLRVVLEPSAPVHKYKLPEGPTYVMMCYNLYGTHSGPGPKADREFLKDLSRKMAVLPGEKNFALATGGFDWDAKGNVTAITEEKAMALIEQYNVRPIRDRESQSLVFYYTSPDGIKHEVWFADEGTLSYWMNTLKAENNNKFSLWRLGGNTESTLITIGSKLQSIKDEP